MIDDPAIKRIAEDREEADFVSGLQAGHWRVIAFDFPNLDFAISATEPDGTTSEYGFRAELTNYPAQAPMVRIWDHANNIPLANDRRPKGEHRVTITFQVWGSDTVYRPWDRMAGPHDATRQNNTHMAWHPDRRLSYIFRDLHGILNSNARAHRLRASA